MTRRSWAFAPPTPAIASSSRDLAADQRAAIAATLRVLLHLIEQWDHCRADWRAAYRKACRYVCALLGCSEGDLSQRIKRA